MKFDITLNGVTVTKEIPTSWDQVTFRQLLDLTETDELKALSTFTGIDPDTLRKAQITGLDKLLTALSFIQRPVSPALLCKEIHTKEQTYSISLDIGFDHFGQYIDIKESLDGLEKIEDKEVKGMETLKLFPLLCATYAATKALQYRYDELNETIDDQDKKVKVGQYDFRIAKAITEDFFNAPCTEVMAVGNFILMKLIALRSTIESNYQRQGATRMQRFRLALKAWWTNTAFTVRYFIWKKRHRLTVEK